MHPGRSGQTTEIPAKASFAVLAWQRSLVTVAVDVNRFRGQPDVSAYLAVWMYLMTPLPGPRRPKFRLTML